MNWVLIGLATLIACEILKAVPFGVTLSRVTAYSRKAARTVSSSRISDHWKERVLPAFAMRIAMACILILGMLMLVVLPYALIGVIYPTGFAGLIADLARPVVIVAMLVGSVAYLWLRTRGGKKNAEASDYSTTDKLLHRLALGAPVLPEMIHDLERGRYLKQSPDARNGDHVFICGLARAGTTILTRELYGSGAFGSLTYRDMPFVMAPNLWANMSRHSKMEAKDRAHGDGIQVDLDSPEALDEVYWRVTCGKDYITDKGLTVHKPYQEELDGFADYISLILRRTGKARYLSKNNNNILRLPSLAATLPNARFLVPVRDPLQHAASLLSQHKRFQTADGFEESYFKWLGHHEFGKAHKPFLFEGRPTSDPMTLDYWLQVWIASYDHLRGIKDRLGDAVQFVSYEALCRDPAYQAQILQGLGMAAAPFAEMRDKGAKPIEGAHPDLAARAADIHASLI